MNIINFISYIGYIYIFGLTSNYKSYFLIFSIDSIISGLQYFMNYFYRNYQVLVYNNNIIHRYIYYLNIILIFEILNIIYWDKNIYLYFIYLTIIYPSIQNFILSVNKINTIILYYYIKIKELLIFILCFIISKLLNNVLYKITNKSQNITIPELLPIINSLTLSEIFNLSKILLISTIIYYFEYKNYKINTHIVNILYKNKYIFKLDKQYFPDDEFSDIKDPIKKLDLIISNRRWPLFFNPKILKLIIYICMTNNNYNIMVSVNSIIISTEIYLSRFFGIYAFINFFNYIYYQIFFLCLSSLLVILEKSYHKIIYRFLGISLLYYGYDNYIIITFITELLELFDNSLFRTLITKLYNNYIKLIPFYILFNNYINIIHYIGTLFVLKNINNLYFKYIICLISKDPIFYSYIWYFSNLSNFNTLHIFYLILLYHILYNIYMIIQSDISISPNKINIEKSYLSEKCVSHIKSDTTINLSNIDIINDFFSL